MAPPPDDYGWAYIDPQRATASADGPSGSLQFRWGSDELVPGRFSGSEDLVFYAASDGHKSTPHGSGSALYLYGNMYVTGAIHASSYTIRNITSTEIDISGSTVFGDSSDDTHQRTGSLEVSGPTHLKSTLSVTGAVSPLSSSGEIHASRLVSNDIFTSGSVGVGTSTPTAQPAEKNDLVIGNHTGNRGMTIAAVNTGVGTIRFARSTSANDGEGWIDYSGNSKKMRIGTDGLTTRVVVDSVGTQVTGTLEVSSNANIAGNAKFGSINSGTGSTNVTTFYNTLSGAAADDGGGDIFVNQLYANDIFVSGTATGITATYVSGTSADPRSYSYEGWETQGYLKASGSLTLGGDAVIGGLLKMPDNMSAKILVADGTSYQEVAVSGDVSISSAGVVTIAAAAVENSMVNENVIGSATNLGATAAQADELLIYDADASVGDRLKAITISNLEDTVFSNVSGDATVAAGGALTIAANAVEGSMLNTDVISAQTEMTGDVADTDEVLISDAGTLKRADFSILRDAVFNDVSGDATVAAGGALTIAANAVEGSMLNTDVISAQTNMTGDVADTDELLISDAGQLRRIDFSVFRDAVFADVSGDATVAAGGALTIANGAVENGMVSENVIGSATNLGGAAAQTDELLIYDADASVGARLKAITFSNLEDTIFSSISGDATVASGGALTLAGSIPDSKLNTISTAGKVALSALEIDGANDIGAALVDADLIIVDDGAGGTNRKAEMSRIKTYTKTDVGTAGTVEADKAIIVSNAASITGGLTSVTGSKDLYFKDVKATSNLISDGGLLVSGSATIAAGLSSSYGMAIPDNEHLRFGAGNDLKIFHNGSNNLFVGQTGHMRFDNQATGKHIQMDLGADDATTKFQVRNNSGNELLVVDGVGMQVTGTLEVSSNANFTAATSHEAGLTSTTMSGSGNLSAQGSAHIGGTLTMDGAGIVFNVSNTAGTVNLQVNDGSGADTALTFGRNGKVTKIGDDTPSDGQYLSWDALGGKVAWADGTTPDMSGSDNHYSSTEFRTSGDLKVSGSVTLAGINSGTPVSSLFLGLDSNNNIVKAAAGGNWVLEDDDGTEVTVGPDSEIKFIGSGITTNWTDTSDGSDADPYDLTFTVDAAQTGITSILATDLKIGEDNETKIDFEDPNTINFYANNVKEMVLVENALTPGANDGTALGTTSLGWSDLHLADGGEILFGNDQDVKLVHEADKGLIVKRTATGDANPTTLTVQSGETGITNLNVIGHIDWKSSDSSGGDAAEALAQISAVATFTHASDRNDTRLEFKTAGRDAAAAVKAIEIDSEQTLRGYYEAGTTEGWNITPSGSATFEDLAIKGNIVHVGDTDTSIKFTPNTVSFHAGNNTQPLMELSTNSVVFNEGSNAADFRIESNADQYAFFIDGGDAAEFCKVAGGYGSTGVTIGKTGSIAADNFIHSDERIQSNTYLQAPAIYDGGGNVALSFDNSNGYIDNDVVIESNTARLDLASKTGETVIGIYGPGGTISDGGNIGRINWYGAETDGKDGNTAHTAYILVEGDDSAGWTYNSSLGTMMKFAVGMRGTTTLQEVLYLTGYDTDYAKVGIGTADPVYKLEVEVDDSTYVAQFRQHATNGNGIRIRNADDSAGRHVTFANDAGTNGGHITMDGTTVSYGAFTAYHPAALPEADNDTGYDYGTLVKIASVDSTTHSKSVLYSVEKTTAAQDKAVFGVYSTALGVSYNDDGTEDMESGRHSIFAVGDGHILVCSEGGNIETGDYICSSNTVGHGMKQSDDILRNYTVAKASEPVDWSTEESSTKLIACTYHAG